MLFGGGDTNIRVYSYAWIFMWKSIATDYIG